MVPWMMLRTDPVNLDPLDLQERMVYLDPRAKKEITDKLESQVNQGSKDLEETWVQWVFQVLKVLWDLQVQKVPAVDKVFQVCQVVLWDLVVPDFQDSLLDLEHLLAPCHLGFLCLHDVQLGLEDQ